MGLSALSRVYNEGEPGEGLWLAEIQEYSVFCDPSHTVQTKCAEISGSALEYM